MLAAVVQLNTQDDVVLNLSRAREWIGRAAAAGAELVTLPENFAFMGEEARKRELAERLDGAFPGPILSALAEEAAAQHGKHPRGRQTYGKSLIIDPWGEVVAQASEGEGFAVARLDFEYQDRVRTSLPSLLHRKW